MAKIKRSTTGKIRVDFMHLVDYRYFIFNTNFYSLYVVDNRYFIFQQILVIVHWRGGRLPAVFRLRGFGAGARAGLSGEGFCGHGFFVDATDFILRRREELICKFPQ